MIDHRFERRREFSSQHPVRVRNVLDHRPQADESRVGGERPRWCPRRRPLSKSTQPTTPAMNGVSRASSSRKRVSATVGAACTRMVEPTPACGDLRREVLRQEVAVDRRERGRQPAVVAAIEAPEMLVAVDHGAWLMPAAARARSTRPRSRSARQNAARNGMREHRGAIARLGAVGAAGDHARDRRMSERELQRRGLQRHGEFRAQLLRAAHALEHVGAAAAA